MNVSSPIAMQIAGVNPARFNEAVSEGFYGCAPKVVPGAKRMFDADDLVGLFVFGQLLRDRVPPRLAGAWACQVTEVIRMDPRVRTYYRATLVDGTHHDIYRVQPGHGRDDVLYAQLFDIPQIRRRIAILHDALMQSETAPGA